MTMGLGLDYLFLIGSGVFYWTGKIASLTLQAPKEIKNQSGKAIMAYIIKVHLATLAKLFFGLEGSGILILFVV